VSLRILFADDSVTAQNMGKKILTDAGYEVVAVSNGAAAVKKIAEQKPDIIILDVYMPGYSGLEVCEKVRGSIETLKTPVLLTVGKMEPYKPEEANRVRADGVIVKPFEASDLLAIVKKFEERIGQMSSPTLVQPILVDRFHESTPPPLPRSSQELPVEPEPALMGSAPQATVEVPDHMATTSAFSDLLNTEHAMDNFNATPATPIAARPSSIQAPLPDYDIPVSWRRESLPEPTVISSPAAAAPAAAPEPPPPPAPAPVAVAPPPPLPIRPRPIPVYQEPKESRSPLEIVPTAAAPIGDVDVLREPELQETAAETTRNTVADVVEPGLIPTRQQEEQQSEEDFAARAAAELAPVEAGVALSVPQEAAPIENPMAEPLENVLAQPEEESVLEPEPVERKTAESDFEARVAAAMKAYNSASQLHEEKAELPATSPITGRPATPASEPLEADPVMLAPETAPEESSVPSVAPEVAQEHAPVIETATAVAVPVAIHADSGPDAQPQPETARPSMEAGLPAAGASDHETIAQAVHRVMERLKPELVDEIVRELKAKK
jgi:CheY-like chemotaxis protein